MTMLYIRTLLVLLLTIPMHVNATDMQLVNLNGAEEPLNNYIGNGQWVVVNVWSPTCSACIIELPRIKKFISRNPDIPVLGVTLDFPSFGYGRIEILQNFVARTPLDYPLFLADMDMASELIDMRLVGIPLIAIFHPDGRPVVRWLGQIEVEEIEQYIKHYKEETDPLRTDF